MLFRPLPFRLPRPPVDGFLLALVAMVGLATLLPARGVVAPIVGHVTFAAIALLFFLYGIKLSPRAVAVGLSHWRLQGFVFLSTYVVFPLIGLAVGALARPYLPAPLVLGLVYTCTLPSTVQASIAFTAIARGNVSAALCSASVSNLTGIVATPVLVMLMFHTAAHGFSLTAFRDIAIQILLPFVAGQAVRPWASGWVARHAPLTQGVDRGSILIIVYAAFSEGIVAGIWSRLTPVSLGLVVACDALILALILAFTMIVSRRLGFSPEDRIAIVFCGSKKSMAAGISMANILFAGQGVGLMLLPLMLFHQIQLFACASLARRYARRPAAVAADVALPGRPAAA